MFKNSKISSDQVLKKETLEALGYAFEYMSKKTGWRWVGATSRSDSNQPTEAEIIGSAWDDAAAQTCTILDIAPGTWDGMNTKEQKEMIDDALSR